MNTPISATDVAIVGLAGRFPGAPDIARFWANVRDGVESVSRLDDADLRARGVPQARLDDPQFVRAGVLFDGMDRFDAGYFGYAAREAERLDPQQRLFLETAVEALQHAGRDVSAVPARTGVFAGTGGNRYLLQHLLSSGVLDADTDPATLVAILNGNEKDALCTRVAYKLDLRGPAVTVQTACSTSLVAVHLACQSLLAHESDLALAGGVSLHLAQAEGYVHQPGSILSPDGHCRPFSADAAGTIGGSGVGVVVLKRLADALADGDTVHAVIKGSAINNDGAGKVGFTAPSVDGQADAIRAALDLAGVPADSIGYVEAHGTGTLLGDPVEVAALTAAFRADTERNGFCALGSVKGNIGHLDAAAGVTGLIKTVLALSHRILPPSLHADAPNPRIDFAASPFRVNTVARPWVEGPTPRRAGVSAFGMGGTNAHVVLEEAPPAPRRDGDAGWHLLPVSARSEAALADARERLAAQLDTSPPLALADVAATLQHGRKAHAWRSAVVARTPAEAALRLRQAHAAPAPDAPPPVAFLFPGQGAQHVGMARSLFAHDAAFRDLVVDSCRLLRPHMDLDLQALLFGDASADLVAAQLGRTEVAQPALFVVSHALARRWIARGVTPGVMLGHSLGEYVAACLAGVFDLPDALALVATRGRLMQSLPPGAMLAVPLPEAELAPWLAAGCDVAAVNGPQAAVLSGPVEAIADAERVLAGQGVAVRRLAVSHAFHSAMTTPVLDVFAEAVRRVPRHAPRVPFVSNVTGREVTASEVVDPDYWVSHLRGTVRFADGLQTVLARPGVVLLEVGPGDTLASLARRRPDAGAVIASLAHARQRDGDDEQHAAAQAALWRAGVPVAATPADGARRVPLPAYPFERQSYWVAPTARGATPRTAEHRLVDGCLAATWQQAPHLGSTPLEARGAVVVFGERCGLVQAVLRCWAEAGRQVLWVESGARFEAVSDGHARARPDARDDLAQALRLAGPVAHVVHLWGVDADPDRARAFGFGSTLALAQALQDIGPAGRVGPVDVRVVTAGIEDVTGDEPIDPVRALTLGPCRVMPHELADVECRVLDVQAPAPESAAERRLVAQLLAETAPAAAFRGAHRWLPTHAPLGAGGASRIRDGGVWLITGGFGGVGLALASHLARRHHARLVLVGRTAPAADDPRIAALGNEVLCVAADVTDAVALRAAVDAARARFGALHGVIHAAGVAGGGAMAQRQPAAIEAVLAPKVDGARALAEALREVPLDAVVLCSALGAVLPSYGQADYVAANAFLDAWARLARRDAPWPVVSIGWDVWRDVGMAAKHRLPDGIGIAPEDGGAVLDHVLAGPAAAHVIVCSRPLDERRAQMSAMDLDAIELVAAPRAPRSLHARPALATPLVAPADDLEAALAALWGDLLGFSEVGVDDNFFELGGDSLMAVQMLADVRARYDVRLHPADVFDAPTVAGLAAVVELRLIEQIETT